MKRMCVRVGIVLFLLIFSSQIGEAQIYFGITPIRAEHDGRKGENITDIIYVRNNAKNPIRIRVYVENWFLREDGTPEFVGNKPADFSCKDWIQVNPQDFRLNPNEMKMVRYTISIPDDAPAAGFHASVSFENVPLNNTDSSSSQMVFTGKIAAAIYIKVGNIEPDIEILDLTLIEEKDQRGIKLFIKNNSQTHFRTQGTIVIRDEQGRDSHEIEIPNVITLPIMQREIFCEFKEILPAGNYSVFCKLDIGRKELFGFEKKIVIKNED